MYHRTVCWLASLWLLGFGMLPAAFGQTTADEVGRGSSGALPYTIAFLFTLIVLVIVCAPSRKAIREED